MQELNVINTLLVGHAITINGVKQILVEKEFKSNNSLLICEIGCGGGDNLNAIYKALKRKLHLQMIGVDIKGACLLSAKKKYPLLPANWIENSYEKTTFRQQPDIIFSSLFCHHFSDEALVYQLKWMYENATIGFFINDLHRHPLAYYSIKWLTKLFSKSYLIVKGVEDIKALKNHTILLNEEPVILTNYFDIAIYNEQLFKKCNSAELEKTFICLEKLNKTQLYNDYYQHIKTFTNLKAHNPLVDAYYTWVIFNIYL
jgi:2-polyprenyl-3-methyl-5-hydroxy-6-metoxy-1,4-benzoquinol methylase